MKKNPDLCWQYLFIRIRATSSLSVIISIISSLILIILTTFQVTGSKYNYLLLPFHHRIEKPLFNLLYIL